MKKPAFVSPSDELTPVTRVFSTPLVVKDRTWIPLTQLAAWAVMVRAAKKRLPVRTWTQSIGIGAVTSTIILLSEWGHNFAHAAAANFVGRPADAIRIIWGMPLLVYYDINDQDVSPREHIIRALGGPIFNLLILPLALLLRWQTRPQSAGRDAANAAVGANMLIPAIGLLPIPGLDGGPILKWSLVDRGQTPTQADAAVRRVNGFLGPLLTLAGGIALKKKRRLTGSLLLALGGIAISIARGFLKEQ